MRFNEQQAQERSDRARAAGYRIGTRRTFLWSCFGAALGFFLGVAAVGVVIQKTEWGRAAAVRLIGVEGVGR